MIKITPQHEPAIKTVCKMANQRASIQALGNVLIDADKTQATLTAGDGTVEINATIDAEVKTGGSFMVDAQKFTQALGACNYDAEITIKDGHIMVKAGRRKFKLTTLSPDAYPAYEMIGEAHDVKATIEEIKAVSISCANGDARQFLNGVYIGEQLAASDGHRITVAQVEQGGKNIIIPAESVRKAPDGSTAIKTDGRTVSIEYPGMVFKSRLIDGAYPDFGRCIRPTDKRITVNAESLADAIKAAAITNETINISFNGESGRLSGVSRNQDETDIGFDATGDEVSMSLNAKYLIDALSFYSGETVLGFNDNQLVIDGDYRSVVMCVRS